MTLLFILAAGLSAILIGIASLAGWLFGLPGLTTWAAASLPMAPITAVLTCALGASLVFCGAKDRDATCRLVIVLSVPTLVIAVTVLLLRVGGYYPRFEQLGLAIAGTFDDAPLGFMSPMTAACFALAAVALTAQALPRREQRLRLVAALSASAVLIMTGFASLLTTLLGYPWLAGPTRIPIAVNTSVVLLLVGSGLGAVGLRLFDRSRVTPGHSEHSWRRLGLGFAALVLLTIGAGYSFYRQEETEIRAEAMTELEGLQLVRTADAAAAAAGLEATGLDVQARAVEGTEWTILAAASGSRLRSELWERLQWVLSLAIMFLLSAAAIVTLMWRTQRAEESEERASLAEAMRMQAIRISDLAARSPAVLYTLRLDGDGITPTDMTSNVERVLGYTVAEALDPTWFAAHIFPEDFDATMAAPAALATEDELVNEFRFVRKDGSILWISNQMTVTRREAGRPVQVTGAWHDVSARREAESALRESEERLRLALVSAAQGLWDLNIQTDEAIVSPEYATMLGFDPATFRETNTSWRERLHPDDREPAATVYWDYVEGRRDTYSVEFRQQTTTGEWKWILSMGKIISRTADGRPLRMLGTHTDITARKTAELRSERLAELYEALSNCNFAIAHCTDQDDLFQRVCDAAASISGVASVWVGLKDPETGFVLRRAATGAGPEDHKVVSADNSEFGRGPTGTAIRENRACWLLDLATAPSCEPWRPLITQYGWVAAGSFPLRCDGRAIGALTIYASSVDAFDEDSRRLLLEMSTSVSSAMDHLARERRRAVNDEALRESESRYRALFADTAVPRLVLDPQSGRIVDANDAAATFYGYPLSRLTSMHISAINPLGREAIGLNLAMARSGERRAFEFQHRLASGELRDVQVFTTSISFNGETLLLSTIFDVTESRRASAVLRAALGEREALLKEVHHRVKNNLQVISSLLRLERERHVDALVRSAIGEMQLRILSMALLHETLYRSTDLARVDLGVYLADLAGQVFRSSAPSTGAIRLRTNLASVLVDIDHAVPCGLLVNEILSNCLKHGFPDGRAGDVSIDLQPIDGGRSYLLSIRDTGVGLPADFESRQNNSLGVHLIRVLARQLKASLAIDGRDGATFSIAFAPQSLPSPEVPS